MCPELLYSDTGCVLFLMMMMMDMMIIDGMIYELCFDLFCGGGKVRASVFLVYCYDMGYFEDSIAQTASDMERFVDVGYGRV